MLERMWKAGNDAPAIGREIARELIDAARKSGRLRGVVISSVNNDVDEMRGLVREASS
jgi:hypothetical protein